MLIKDFSNLNNNSDFKDWLFEDDGSEALKKWIRYCAVDYGDADQIIKKSGWFKKLNWSDDYIDCIFSFKSYFNGFLKSYLEQFEIKETLSWGYILDHYDVFFDSKERIKILKEKYNFSDVMAHEFWEQLNKFARLTHTIGNYMPCPDKDYNGYKGFNKGYLIFQDRIDLLYKEICENKNDYAKEKTIYKKWLEENAKKYLIEEMLKPIDYHCSIKNRRCYIENENEIKKYLEYLKIVNSLIENRKEKM